MRIRKHAKISPLIYAASSLKPGTLLQTHVCQLNQSPWDVMSFSPPSTPPPPLPPPSFQVSGNDDFDGNGSFRETIAAFQSTESMKMSMDEGETEAMKLEYSGSGTDSGSAMDMVEEGVSGQKDKEVVLCGKTDGKAWKCKRMAWQGNSLCDHHLSLRSYNNVAQLTAKKADKAVVDSRRRPRTKKAASTSSASNPYEFYYYSGFGPRWGKKRGETSQISNSRDVSKDVDKKREMRQSSLSQIESEESEMQVEIEYEEEDEDNSESESQRKRARKPIKARSLKSLM